MRIDLDIDDIKRTRNLNVIGKWNFRKVGKSDRNTWRLHFLRRAYENETTSTIWTNFKKCKTGVDEKPTHPINPQIKKAFKAQFTSLKVFKVNNEQRALELLSFSEEAEYKNTISIT